MRWFAIQGPDVGTEQATVAFTLESTAVRRIGDHLYPLAEANTQAGRWEAANQDSASLAYRCKMLAKRELAHRGSAVWSTGGRRTPWKTTAGASHSSGCPSDWAEGAT